MPVAGAGLLAFAVCACMLPLLRRIADHWHVYDQPGELKVHRQPIARIGGVAMMAGVLTCLLPAAIGSSEPYILCLLAIAAVWAVGLADDIRSLSAISRLAAQGASAALFWVAGWRLHWSARASMDLLLTIFFVVFIVNVMNWLDGMDGLAAATAAVAAVGFLLLPMGTFAHTAAWALVGVCLGLLLVNFPPASLFMGDSGSMLIGMLFAFLCLDWVRTGPSADRVISPLLFIALPLSDGLFAIVRRLRMRHSPFLGDRRHFYDLLAARDWPASRVVLASMLATTGFVALGRLSHEAVARQFVIVPGIAFLLLVARLLGCLHAAPAPRDAQKAQALMNSIGMALRRISHS